VEPRDRILYHQIHPLKLAVDWGTAFVAAGCFWAHQTPLAFTVGFVPSIIASVALIRWSDLGRYRDSELGRRLAHGMTRPVEGARFLGLLPFWGGAWRHEPLLVGAGVAWIIGCWGLALRRPASDP